MRGNWLRSAKGFTMAETAAVLTAASIVAGTAAPAVQDYISQARMLRAREDTHTIASAIVRFADDVADQGRKAGGWATFDLLVGAGSTPTLPQGGGDNAWLAEPGAQVGILSDHLVTNAPVYPTHKPSMVNWLRGWHGPYLEAGVGADPWGNRYAVNVKAFKSGDGATFVLTAGPNGQLETPFNTLTAVPAGDDVIGLISGAN